MSEIRNGSAVTPRQTVTSLNIDNIVSSHPELGPTPPDGGYGWLILIGALIVQITVSSIISAYGIIILYLNHLNEYEDNQVFRIWDKNIVLVPILITVFWLLLEPWSRTIVLISNRPRVVSISGVMLMGAGIMLSNFSVESEENDIIINVFSGILIGIGASLTSQQTEILLAHYFRKKIVLVQKIYKTGVAFGNVLISLFIGLLCLYYGASMTLIIYAGFVIQQCFLLMIFSRPTYVVKATQQNYKILREATEDEDLEIYSSQTQVSQETNRREEDASNNNKQETVENNEDDDQDEIVIGTFNNTNNVRETTEPPSPVLVRYESVNNNPFGSSFVSEWDRIDRFVEPQDLYRETTIASDMVPDNNIFNYEPPTAGTLRRTATTKKNVFILLSVLKDKKFYAFTHILLTLKFSMLVFGILIPTFISQKSPTMTMVTVFAMVTVMYIGSLCLTIVSSFFTTFLSEKLLIRFFNILAAVAFILLCEVENTNWLAFCGMLAIFATNSIYIAQKPIFNIMTLDFDASAISIVSNCLSALLVLFLMLVHNYIYSTCFIMAAVLHILSLGASFLL